MKITLESTGELVPIDGRLCRVWQGATLAGVTVTAFVARVAVAPDADASEFQRELLETAAPSGCDLVTPGQRAILDATITLRKASLAARKTTGDTPEWRAYWAADARLTELVDAELARAN